MRTFLLTWNPSNWAWTYLDEAISKVAVSGYFDDHWSFGNRRDVNIGDRVFLIRLGVEPRGIVASGYVTSPAFYGRHWDGKKAEQGKTANYVNVRFDAITESPAISIPELKTPPLHDMHWEAEAGGILIAADVAESLSQLWRSRTSTDGPLELDRPPTIAASYVEGHRRELVSHAYERSRGARQECVDHSGYACACCDVVLADRYGPVAEGFIHVHHLTPVSEAGEPHVVDPTKDLVPVCPNCHAIIHRKSPPLTVQQVRELLELHSSSSQP